jgi:ATP-dependent RNA helicase DOB1
VKNRFQSLPFKCNLQRYRAGRRGKDDRGLVILMMDERMDPAVAKDMLHGRSDPLNSAFHLTYSMILNLIRLEGGAPENLMGASFAQFQNDRNLPKLEAAAAALGEERDAVEVEDGEAVAEYVNLRDTLAVLQSERRDVLNLPAHSVPFLQPGRLVRVCTRDPRAVSAEAASAGEDGGAAARAAADVGAEWGMVVSFDRNGTEYLVDVLCMIADQPVDKKNPAVGGRKRFQIKPIVPAEVAEGEEGWFEAEKCEPRVVQVPLSQVDCLSSVRVYSPKDLRPIEGRQRVQKSIAEVIKRFPDGIPLLNPEEDMKVEGAQFRKLVRWGCTSVCRTTNICCYQI